LSPPPATPNRKKEEREGPLLGAGQHSRAEERRGRREGEVDDLKVPVFPVLLPLAVRKQDGKGGGGKGPL